MQIDVIIAQLINLISFFEKYREFGFNDAMIEAKKIAEVLEIEPIIREKHITSRKIHFDEEKLAQSALNLLK